MCIIPAATASPWVRYRILRRPHGVAEGMAEVQHPAPAAVLLVPDTTAALYWQQRATSQGRFGCSAVSRWCKMAPSPMTPHLMTSAMPGDSCRRGRWPGTPYLPAPAGAGKKQPMRFFLRQVQTGLAADAAVHLGQQGGGQLGQSHAPQQGTGYKARQVTGNAAAQGRDAVLPGEAVRQQPAAQVLIHRQALAALPRREGYTGRSRAPA